MGGGHHWPPAGDGPDNSVLNRRLVVPAGWRLRLVPLSWATPSVFPLDLCFFTSSSVEVFFHFI